jgi:hypothetical protein
MFCPLCTAEYREGFTVCNDCRVPLVQNLNSPESHRARFWKGDRPGKLDHILRALDDAGIPCHFKEIVNAVPRLQIMGIPIGPQRSTFEYEVWIFSRDLIRARAAIGPG